LLFFSEKQNANKKKIFLQTNIYLMIISNKTKNKFPLLVLTLTVFIFLGCSNKIFFDEKVLFPDANWTYENKEITFKVHIDDLEKPYSVFIELDLIDIPSVDKFFSTISILSPNGGESVRPVTINFNNPKEPYILGANENEKTYKLTVYPKRYFPEAGIYTFIVGQYSNKADNYGIRSLRLYIEKLKEKKN
jgi:hypothetical protein